MNQASNPMGNNDDTGAIPREAVSERVEKLVQTFQDCRDRGSDATIEEVCAHDPEMVTAVRAWLTKVGNMEAMLATQAPTGSTLRGSWGEDNILSAPQAPDELGRLGGYRILKLIGQGGMGKVYLAEDIKLKRRVAVKVLLKGGDKRFLREAQTLAMVDHDHIVTIYQMDEERGTMYLAMPYLQGETLDARLAAKTRLPLADCLRITRQIALGLAAAHHRGVIHRDIKPSNIWLEEGSDRVKILDFGLAQDSKAETLLTQEGSVVGTPAYMAPEQAQGIKVDHRADLFSLGCVLYQMICGMSPFARKDILSTLRALELETPELPKVRAPEIPGPLSDLAMDLLAKKAADRPANVDLVLERLQAIERNIANPGSEPHLEPKRPRSGNRLAIFGAVAAVGLVALAYLVWPSRSTTGPAAPSQNPPDVIAAAPPAKAAELPPVKIAVLPSAGKTPDSKSVEPTPLVKPNIELPNINRFDFKINVQLPNIKEDDQGVRRLAEGQAFQFKIDVDQKAYVGVWFLADDGSVKQLFPNEFDRDNLFEKGKTYQIPSNNEYTLEATPSKKTEMFRVIASTKPWNWDPKNADGGFRVFRDTKEFDELVRGVVLVANPNNPLRVSQISMPVWVSPKTIGPSLVP
jgi:hypothetical protein